jgi:hypothetical protein
VRAVAGGDRLAAGPDLDAGPPLKDAHRLDVIRFLA